VNRLLHDDDPAREGPAPTRAANAEILELLTLDDPGVLAPWASLDRSRVRVSVEAPEQSYASVRRVLDTARARAAALLPPDFGVTLSGEIAIQFDWIHDVQGTQLRSFPTALALVYAMVAFFLRSARLALAAMVPTLLPVVTVLGAMGWAGTSLDVGRAMIAAVVIGLAVDESIHVLDHYRRERAVGAAPRLAVRTALQHTARAAVTTSIALTLGFLTLLASSWQTISSFGFFVSLAILGALAAALFVLPALLLTFAGRAETGRRARPGPA
jgi:predicted RND superfamily exporter protein